jgi:hypothetical protein
MARLLRALGLKPGNTAAGCVRPAQHQGRKLRQYTQHLRQVAKAVSFEDYARVATVGLGLSIVVCADAPFAEHAIVFEWYNPYVTEQGSSGTAGVLCSWHLWV